ncbi:MAG: CocE/NonD family hydrolase, partial [Candidatus Hodarchaeales archaeon]
MIDIIIGIFLQLDQAGVLNFKQMISNLILLVVSRSIYLSTYYISYLKNDQKQIRDRIAIQSRSDLLLLILPQIVIIIGGMVFFLPAISISIYSLLMSGVFIKNYAQKTKSPDLNMIGNLVIAIIPLISIYRFFLTQDHFSLAVVAVTLIIPLISIYRFFLTQDHFSLAVVAVTLLFFFLSQQMDLSTYITQKINAASNPIYRIGRAIYGVLLLSLIIISSIITIGTVINAPSIQTVMVEMRDGTELATDIYIAPNSLRGPRPVILTRTPYGKNSMSEFRMLYSTQGYHMVVQDLRGTGGSGDNETFVMFQRDYQDGVDTLNWILEQTWCNGEIASIGLSALAINAFAYAGMNPTGLVAQSLVVGTPDLYTVMFPGGAFREAMITQWIESTSPWNMDFQLNQMIAHAKKDSYYNTTSLYMEPGPTFEQVNVPALHIGGWYDCFQQGTLNGYMGYDDFGGTGARGKQLLIMGPFTHGFPGEGRIGEVVFPTKIYSASSLYFDWETKLFDHVLLQKDFDWSGDRVAYYMMGDLDDNSPDINDYRFATDWPIPGYSNVSWYLTDSGSLQVGTAGLNNRNYSYNFDPRDP